MNENRPNPRTATPEEKNIDLPCCYRLNLNLQAIQILWLLGLRTQC